MDNEELARFITRINELNNEELAQELYNLFLINPEQAQFEYRIALARKIMAENKSLFEKLSKL